MFIWPKIEKQKEWFVSLWKCSGQFLSPLVLVEVKWDQVVSYWSWTKMMLWIGNHSWIDTLKNRSSIWWSTNLISFLNQCLTCIQLWQIGITWTNRSCYSLVVDCLPADNATGSLYGSCFSTTNLKIVYYWVFLEITHSAQICYTKYHLICLKFSVLTASFLIITMPWPYASTIAILISSRTRIVVVSLISFLPICGCQLAEF